MKICDSTSGRSKVGLRVRVRVRGEWLEVRG
jgi:hypothetical protein